MNNLKTVCAVVTVLFFSIYSLNSQAIKPDSQEKVKVILYNSQPVKVELAGDKINSFIGEAPKEYMEGYELSSTKTRKEVLPLLAPVSTDAKVTSAAKELVNANYSILLDQKFHLNFKPGFATLDKAMINKLNDIATELKSDPAKKILLTSYINSEVSKSKKLADNRHGAATAYLKIKGISLDRIQTENRTGNELVDVLAVNFML